MGRTTKEIRERIAEKEEKLDRELTNRERNMIIKSVKRKVARENFVRGTLMALGLTTIGAGGHALLTSGEEKATEGNKTQTETQLDSENENSFKDDLHVEVSPIIEEENSQIRDDVEKEIEELGTSEEILNYIKDIYINEYNEQNNQNYTKDQLTFRKARGENVLHGDTAENGDIIIRKGYERDNYVDTAQGVITATIKDENNYIKEEIVNYAGNYKTVYSEDEKVDKYEDNFLVSIAPVVDTGIDWSVAMEQEGTSEEVKEEYKDRLINAVTEYETTQKEQTEEQER